ncbi:MAG TPA: hypothetical protein VGJ13_10520 [Pseudonocardiaceae bacterium]
MAAIRLGAELDEVGVPSTLSPRRAASTAESSPPNWVTSATSSPRTRAAAAVNAGVAGTSPRSTCQTTPLLTRARAASSSRVSPASSRAVASR